MPTQAVVVARVRSDLNEASARFFQNDELVGWLADGGAAQHRIAIEMARSAKKLKNIAHPYLKKYGKVSHINVTAGVSLYALPTDFLAETHVSWMDGAGLKERDAIDYTDGEDWMTENIPHLAPTYSRPGYAFRWNETTGLPAIKLYAFGDNGVPNSPGVLRLYYLRDFIRPTAYVPGDPFDADDPYAEGPRFYADAQGKLKRGEDPSGYLGLADRCAQNIFGPMSAAAATGQKAQAEGAALGVQAGESRDGR